MGPTLVSKVVVLDPVLDVICDLDRGNTGVSIERILSLGLKCRSSQSWVSRPKRESSPSDLT